MTCGCDDVASRRRGTHSGDQSLKQKIFDVSADIAVAQEHSVGKLLGIQATGIFQCHENLSFIVRGGSRLHVTLIRHRFDSLGYSGETWKSPK